MQYMYYLRTESNYTSRPSLRVHSTGLNWVVFVEYIDRAHWATLNCFTETLRVTHPAPANIMDLLMAADGLPTARERCVACSVVSERHDGVYSSHHWQDTFYWKLQSLL